jgi:SLT domain-containing protein
MAADLNHFAGMAVKGNAASVALKDELKACGLTWDAGRREWVVPEGLTAGQNDRLAALLQRRADAQAARHEAHMGRGPAGTDPAAGLECGYYTAE